LHSLEYNSLPFFGQKKREEKEKEERRSVINLNKTREASALGLE
jgi:hypothetical protein